MEKSTDWRPSAGIAVAMAGAYAALGVSLPFLPRWLEVERGLTGAEIGLIVSSAPLARIVLGPLIAVWADGFQDRRRPLQILTLGALFAYVAFAQADGFWALLVCGFAATTLAAAVSPLLEGAALRAGHNGPLPYGVIRGIGSAAFIIANVAGGLMVSQFGPQAVIAWVVANLAVNLALGAAFLRPDPAPPSAAGSTFLARLGEAGRLLKRRRIALTLAAAGLIQGAHAFYYGFSVLVWRGQGIDAGVAGLLWGFSVAVEIALLLALTRIERFATPEAMIAMGAGASVLRWTALAFAPPAALLWPLQALHALTFAASHVGTMRILHAEAGEAQAGVSQTLYAALGSGLVFGFATMASGALYDAVGARGYLAMTAMALLGCGFIWALWRVPPRPRPPVHGSPPSPPP